METKSTVKVQILKPIIKWVGGKTQIIDKLLALFPVDIQNYHELFLGGGSVLLALLSYVKAGVIRVRGSIYAYDANDPLIYMYKNIQNHHEDLYNEIQTLIRDFGECDTGEVNRKPTTLAEAKVNKENYFYWIRKIYNGLTPEEKRTPAGSAIFIFLNKTCFRGIFRVGPNGYNVPYGHNKNPGIIDWTHLCEIHHLIQGVIFETSDFTVSIRAVGPGDFVYLDPPYAPETDTSFVGYVDGGFTLEHHRQLFQEIHLLSERTDIGDCHSAALPKKIMMSNADVTLVREQFTDSRYRVAYLLCKRTIHSKTPDAKAKEVIVRNYLA